MSLLFREEGMITKQIYMKTKSIILSGLLLASLGAATTSCDDMLNVDDELHTTNLAPQDTVYQVMGILNRMQSLVDRTVLLGELRADLVDLNEAVASTSLQEIMDNNISTDNEYNSIADYYSVINACNVYLAYVDSNYVEHNRKKYEKEIQAVKTYRAWTYLEMAKVYGRVPFVTEPVLTSVEADKIVASTSNRADMNEICTYFINELLPYAQKSSPVSVPNYGVDGYRSQTFFIPVRLMVAELYLWRGSYTHNTSDFTNACTYYFDYINTVNNVVTTGTASVKWNNNTMRHSTDSYSTNFTTADTITIIPMDTCAYDGTWSQLYAMFNSQYENNYYVPIVPSQRIREISGAQVNCVYSEINNQRDTTYSTSKIEWEDSMKMGDLRLDAIYNRSAVSNMYTSQYSQDRQHIMKYATSSSNYGSDQKLKSYTVYRKNIVWLHFAEALNRAGFPQTAFAILKYGLTQENMANYVSDIERNGLSFISSYIKGNISSWDYDDFVTIHSSNYDRTNKPANTIGIHSRGSGDSEYNKYYALSYDTAVWNPVERLEYVKDSLINLVSIARSKGVYVVDTTYVEYDSLGNAWTSNVFHYEFESDSLRMAYDAAVDAAGEAEDAWSEANSAAYLSCLPGWQEEVAQKILDEEALEGAFEGQRFYDLMRFAMYTGDADYIAKQVIKRKGSDTTDPRGETLRGGNWYLPLPTK